MIDEVKATNKWGSEYVKCGICGENYCKTEPDTLCWNPDCQRPHIEQLEIWWQHFQDGIWFNFNEDGSWCDS